MLKHAALLLTLSLLGSCAFVSDVIQGDCGRSFCGCPKHHTIMVEIKLSRGNSEPIPDAALICLDTGELLGTTSSSGLISMRVPGNSSPGWGFIADCGVAYFRTKERGFERPFWFVGLSAGATGNSGFIMLGAAGMGYTMGLSGLIMPLAWFLGDLTFWSFFPEKFNRIARDRDCSTIPELLSSGIPGSGSLAIRRFAGLLIVVLIGAYTAAQFSAAAKTLNVFFDLDMNIGIIVSALAILAYCTTGGLRASLWTDVVQAIIMLAIITGMLAVAYVAAGGVSAVHEGLYSIDPTLTKFTGTFTAWTLIAFVLGYASAGFGFGISQPQIMVRLLAGRSPEKVRKAKWIYIFFIQYTWICMALFGMGAVWRAC